MSPPRSPTPSAGPRRLSKPLHKARSFSFQMLTQPPDKAPLPQAMYSEQLHPMRLPPRYESSLAPSYSHSPERQQQQQPSAAPTMQAQPKPNQYAVAAAAAAVQSAARQQQLERQQQQQRQTNNRTLQGRRSESSLGFYRTTPATVTASNTGRPAGEGARPRRGSDGAEGTSATRPLRSHGAAGVRAVTLPLAHAPSRQHTTPGPSEFDFEFDATIPLDLASTIAVPQVAPLAGEASTQSKVPKRKRRLSFSWFSRS